MAKKRATKKVFKDPLDELAEGEKDRIIMLMLWQNRLRVPDMFVQLTEKDIDGFEACTRYLKVSPRLLIRRPPGLPGQDAIPASPGRRAVPAREPTPPKPYVVVALVDQDGNTFKPIENNEEDYDRSLDAQRVQKAKSEAPMLADRLIAQARSGEYSLSDMQDASQALLILAANA